MRVASFFAGIGGFDLGFDLAERDFDQCLQYSSVKSSSSPDPSSKDAGPASTGSTTSATCEDTTSPEPTSSAVAFPARTSPWPENVRASLVRAAACSMSWCASWMKRDPGTLFGRMFPDFSPPTADMTSGLSSVRWPTSGITEPGGCWTVSTSEWPSGGDDSLACSLREMLDGDVPARYYLSPRAAAGILRRAAKRGRELLGHLMEALSQLAQASGPMAAEDLLETSARTLSLPPSPPAQATTGTVVPGATEQTTSSPTTRISAATSPEPITPGHSEPGHRTPTSSSVAPTLSTNNEVATSSTQREKWMVQSVETVGAVRRLTPVECERLQGFPVGWTIPQDVVVNYPGEM